MVGQVWVAVGCVWDVWSVSEVWNAGMGKWLWGGGELVRHRGLCGWNGASEWAVGVECRGGCEGKGMLGAGHGGGGWWRQELVVGGGGGGGWELWLIVAGVVAKPQQQRQWVVHRVPQVLSFVVLKCGSCIN